MVEFFFLDEPPLDEIEFRQGDHERPLGQSGSRGRDAGLRATIDWSRASCTRPWRRSVNLKASRYAKHRRRFVVPSPARWWGRRFLSRSRFSDERRRFSDCAPHSRDPRDLWSLQVDSSHAERVDVVVRSLLRRHLSCRSGGEDTAHDEIAQAILVFGTTEDNGKASPELTARLDQALSLYRAGTCSVDRGHRWSAVRATSTPKQASRRRIWRIKACRLIAS